VAYPEFEGEENMRRITEEEVMKKQTPCGGWRKKDVAKWGVPWPLPSGWKETILEFGVPYGEAMHLKMDQECDNAMARDRTGDKAWKKKK